MGRRGLPLHVRVLLLTQCLFNIGFYLVVPFIAIQMTDSLGAGGALVGLVLGIRTFSQQGFFFLGGGLADRFGTRPILLTGVALRVIGFLVAGLATDVPTMIAGVILIGFAAALFSPSVEAALAVEGERLEREGLTRRSRLFALDAAWSRLGALLGPVIGALLIPIGFRTVCLVGAGIFALIFITHAIVLRGAQFRSTALGSTTAGGSSVVEGGDGGEVAVGKRKIFAPMVQAWSRVLRNRAFVAFALAYSTYLVAYNMQYLALPVELRRATGSDELLGWFFAVVGVYVIALQGPVNTVAARRTTAFAMRLGFGLMALSFALVAAFAPFALGGWLAGWGALVPALLFVLVLHMGMMIAAPIARDFVGKLAGEKDLGSYYGFLNTFGGIAVLIGSILIGRLLDLAELPGAVAVVPWLVMAGVLLVSGFVLGRQADRFRHVEAGPEAETIAAA